MTENRSPAPEPGSRAAPFAWIAIAAFVASVVATTSLTEVSERSAAWNVIVGGGLAVVALVFGILSFRRRGQLASKALPVSALVVGILAFALPVGAAGIRADEASQADACRQADASWSDAVAEGLADVGEADLAASEKSRPDLTLPEEAGVRLPLYRQWARLGEVALATDPCTGTYRSLQSAIAEFAAVGRKAANATAAYRTDTGSIKLEEAFIGATEEAATGLRTFQREQLAVARQLREAREAG